MAAKKKDSRLTNTGVAGYNKPKRTPNHPKKSHVVVAKEGDKVKTIRFGEQGASTAGKAKSGESDRMRTYTSKHTSTSSALSESVRASASAKWQP